VTNPFDRLVLERISYGPRATVGLLRWSDTLLYTLEDAWRDNRRRESCIPDGIYTVRPRRFYRGGYDALEIAGVPGRSEILFHRGNTAADVQGCIVLGTGLDALNGEIAVLGSAAAWDRFFPVWGNRTFELTIKPIHPLEGTRAYVHREEA